MSSAYRIGEFVLESKLGEGGMGVVFRARQVALDRWVALKLLAKPATGGSTFTERFYREARSGAQLVHPNIIQIYTIGEHKGAPYYAMEYVEGEDLSNLLNHTGMLTTDEAIEVCRAVAKALTLAGDAGIVHRDIKPANIMISISGLVKVMDFGLAKASASDHTLTNEGQIMGTPTYLSPEQGMSKEVDTRSDLYSLGCVLYEALTGKAPFEGDNLPSLVFKHLYEPVKPPRELKADVPEGIEKVCLKLLEKKPEDRYQSAPELLEALAALGSNSAMAELTLAKRSKKVKEAKKEEEEREASESGEEKVEEKKAEELKVAVELGVKTTTSGTLPKDLTPGAPVGTETRERIAAARPAAPTDRTQIKDAPQKTARIVKHRAFEEGTAPAAPARSRANIGVVPAPPPSSAAGSGVRPPVAPGPGGSAVRPPILTDPRGSGAARSAVMSQRSGSSASRPAVTPTKPGSSANRPAVADALRPGTQAMTRKGVSSYFQKIADGRWSYEVKQGHCKYAEGLAAEQLPGQDIQISALGDCLVCSNWTRRSGCAIAATQSIEASSRAKGVELLEEMAAVWCVAGRFDKAIALIEENLKQNPEEPDGYRALARIYERPDYKGRDRPRAVILYQRFIDLAKTRRGYSQMEVERVQMRLNQIHSGIIAQAKDPHPPDAFSELLHNFPCFYRSGSTVYFGQGGISRQSVIIARAGEVDPETGVSASEMGNPFMRATTIIRRIKSEKAKTEEREKVKHELERISKSSVGTLLQEPGRCSQIPLNEIQAVEIGKDDATDQRNVKLRATSGLHELIFSSASGQDAEKAALVIRRLTGR